MLRFYSLLAGILISYVASSQLLISGGLHTVDVSAKDFGKLINKNTSDSFGLKFDHATYGFHFGGGVRINFNNFYLQPELIFNSNEAKFYFTDSTQTIYNVLKTEKYQYLDIPMILGIKFSILRILVGPVAHIFINNSSELTHIDGYKDKFQTATFGYQAGIGFDLSIFSLDLRHEGNFSAYGDHLNFFGSKLNFDNKASRLIGTLSIRL